MACTRQVLAAFVISASVAFLTPASAQNPDPVDALNAQTMMALTRGDTQSARSLARELVALALKLHGKDSAEYQRAMATMATVSMVGGDAKGATTSLTASQPRTQKDAAAVPLETLFGNVEMLRVQGNASDALALLRSAEPRLQKTDDKETYYTQLGDLLYAAKNYAGAADAYDKSAQLWLSGSGSSTISGLGMLAKKALSLHQEGKEAEAGALFDDVAARVEAEHIRTMKFYASIYGPLSGKTGAGQDSATNDYMKSVVQQIGSPTIAAAFEAAGRGALVTSWRKGEIRSSDAALAQSSYKAVDSGALVNNLLGQPGKEADALAEARKLASGARNFERTSEKDIASQRAGDVRKDSVSEFFIMLADADYGFSRSHPAASSEMQTEAFGALQDASNGPASRAVMSAAADRLAGPQAVKRRTLVVKWDQLETAIAAAYAAAKPKDADSLIKSQSDIDQQLRTIDQQIAQQAPGYYSIINPSPLPLTEFQATLRNDEAALLIVPGPRGTQVMAITHKDVSWHEASVTDQALADIVKSLRRSLDPKFRPPGKSSSWAFDRQDAYRLYQQLIAPISPALSDKKQLFIVSTGALYMLPLNVLVTQPPKGSDSDALALRDTSWLSDSFALSQLPSLQSLKILRERSKASGSSRRGMVGFGDPLLKGSSIQRGGADDVRGIALDSLFSPVPDQSGPGLANVALLKRMARLPGTASELNQIHDFMGKDQSRVFLESEATETAVKHSDLSNLRVLVFATHGLLGNTVGPDEPGLVLSPPQQATEQDDGLLTSSEIVGLKLGVDWVVLSACDTAGGSDGVPMSGLSQAFLASGADSLLVSHWPVFDAVAGELTTRTFKDLTQHKNLTRAEALQQAMHEVRMMTDHPEFAHPAYWAPFVLIGDGARQ